MEKNEELPIQRCMRCNRLLTNDKARERGMGKICFEKTEMMMVLDKERNTTLDEFEW